MKLHPRLADYRVALIIGVGTLALVAITPMMVLRFVQGQADRGFVDIGLLLSIVACMTYVWISGNAARAGFFGVLACCIGVGLIAWMDVHAGTAWIYPVIIANFILLAPRQAMGLTLLLVMVTALTNRSFEGVFHQVTFIVTALVTALFGYFFAWRAARQHRALERLSLEDPLTGVGNRRALDTHLAGVPTPLVHGIAVVDLDGFKAINDSHGHLEGDAILRRLADLLRAHLRTGDSVFRYGGEEFLLLMPGVEVLVMAQRMEDLRQAVETALEVDGKPVTVSIGAAVMSAGETMADCFERADQAMYEAKRSGRNRVVLAD